MLRPAHHRGGWGWGGCSALLVRHCLTGLAYTCQDISGNAKTVIYLSGHYGILVASRGNSLLTVIAEYSYE